MTGIPFVSACCISVAKCKQSVANPVFIRVKVAYVQVNATDMLSVILSGGYGKIQPDIMLVISRRMKRSI